MDTVLENNIGRRLRSSTKPKNVAEMKDNFVKNKKATGVNNKRYLKKGGKESVNAEVHTEIKYPGKNPLENPLIINAVFELLNLEEIKQCRLVCTKWNDISKSFVEKMCQIIIGPPAMAECSPETFNEFAGNSDISFRNFKLISRERPIAYWSMPSLVGFFEDQRQKISKLTIDNIVIKQSNPNNSHNYYFSMDPHIGNNLTHLAIDNSDWTTSSKFAVSSDKLLTAQSLSFRNCRVHFVENCRLRPERFEMKNVTVMYNEKRIEVLDVNDHLIIENLRELILQDCFPKVSINLEACDGILENLILQNIIVENLADCKWEIKGKVKLRGIPFQRKSLMQFTELDFGIANLNLEALPDSIEKLTLEKDYRDMDIITPPHLSLPNLKYLQLQSSFAITEMRNPERPMIFLSLFTDCQNLKTVKLVSKESVRLFQQVVQIMKTEWIPRSVENLSLDGNIKVVGDQIHIKRLVIQNNNNLTSLKETLRLLKSDHLVIWLHPVNKFAVRKEVRKAEKLETTKISLTVIESPYESVAIGPFDVNVIGANKGYFLKSVDVDKPSSRHYMFANQKGKAITATEFKKLVEQQK